jgi:putative aldouronate transport system permease protein
MINRNVASVQKTKKTKKKKMDARRIKLLLLALPFVVFILVFCYIPLAGWALAFFNYKPGIPLGKTPFVGFDNFKYIFFFGDDVLNALRNTLVMSGLGILTSPLPVIFAIMLTELSSVRFKKIVQTVTTIPNFISWVIVFSLAFGMFSKYGVVNTLLTQLGLINTPTNLLANRDAVWFFQCTLGIWKGLGWASIVYFAAISGIDAELYDAAKVDGATRFQKIRYITIPLVSETYIVLLLLSVCHLLSNGLEQYMVFYNPMVADRIEVLDYFVYRVGIVKNDYSFATAVSVVKSVVSIAVLFSVNGISKKVRGYSIV